MKRALIISLVAIASFSTFGRSISLKLVGSGAKEGKKGYFFQDKSKRLVADLTIGRPDPKESASPLEIRAASVFKDINTRKAFINDVTTKEICSTNATPRKFKIVSSSAGKMVDHDAKANGGYDFSEGNTIAGIIVEVYKDGKCIKHLSNLPGKDGKTVLNDQTDERLLNEDDHYDFERKFRTGADKSDYKNNLFTNPTKIIEEGSRP